MGRQRDPLPITTVGATPGFLDLMPIEPGQAILIEGKVIAMSNTGQVKAWIAERAVKRTLAGAVSIVGTPPAPVIISDSGVSWTISFSLGGNNGNILRAQCTAAAGVTVRWVPTVYASEVTQPE